MSPLLGIDHAPLLYKAVRAPGRHSFQRQQRERINNSTRLARHTRTGNLHMASNTSSRDNRLLIFVRFDSKHAFPVEVDRSALIRNIQDEVARKHDIPRGDVKIIFQGRILDEQAPVEDYDLGHQTVIHAVRRRQAGGAGRGSPGASTSGAASHDRRQQPVQGLNAISELQTDEERSVERERPRRQFYVYCRTCHDIMPGKLRVCCAVCKQGTLVLDRDPRQWSDIQGSGKLTGRCLEEDCSGRVAEFYFKCANHDTSGDPSDRSAGLELVKSNTEELECVVCEEVSNPMIVFTCENGDCMCLDCFHMYAVTKLNDRAFLHSDEIGYTLTCPEGCDNSLIEDAHHFRILGQDQYDRYKNFAAEEAVLQAGGLLCPRPGCGAGILPDEGEKRIVCLQGCGYVFCRECQNAYHNGACARNGEDPELNQGVTGVSRRVARRQARQSRETIEKTTKPCPKCKVPVEKDGGCMHMTCVRCKFDWCWLCKKEWNRDCQADHWFE